MAIGMEKAMSEPRPESEQGAAAQTPEAEPVGVRHVWRWKDEDPTVIILLVIIISFILAIPWSGCGPAARRGEPKSLPAGAVEAMQAE